MFVWLVLVLDLTITGMNAEQMFHYGTSQHRDYWSVAISKPTTPTLVAGTSSQG